MRARCERHALALGPNGCVICHREQAVAEGSAPFAAPPSSDTARSGAPPAAAPVAEAEPDSAPTAPTVTTAPEPPRLSIRIPPAALALPIAALATYLLLANRPALPQEPESAPRATAQAEATGDEIDRLALEDEVARSEDPSSSDDTESSGVARVNPVDPLLTAAKIVELERTREHAQQLDAARRQVKVVLYTSERCSRCVEARTHLLAQGIRPIERDIDKDSRARARHRALSRKGGLPTIEVDGKVLVGFQEDRVQKAIDRAATIRMQRKR
jgi:glutaredoxin 3